jgi:hypothetical protein
VFFDANSGTVTVTITGVSQFYNFDSTGFTGTIAGSGITIGWYGPNFILSNTTTWSYTGAFSAVGGPLGTIYSNGKSLANLTINRIVALGDALTLTGGLTVDSGSFTTNDFSLTTPYIVSSGANTRTINLGSSTVTLTSGGNVFSTPVNTNLTFNAGTSTITLSGASAQINGAGTGSTGLNFYNVSFTNTNVGDTKSIIGQNSFNNISVRAPTNVGFAELLFYDRQVVNNGLSTVNTAGHRRVYFRSNAYGIAQTLTINSAGSLTDADFRDIIVTGSAAPISGTRIGNLGGCSSINFSTPKTVYWVTTSSSTYGWTGSNVWALSSGGTPDFNNSPLAQDTAIIDNASTIGTIILTPGLPHPTIDASTRTSAWTLSTTNGGVTLYGDLKLGSGVTIAGTQTITFSGRNTQTITSAGKVFSQGIAVDSYGGTVQLADALNTGSNAITITNGTFTTNNYAVTAGTLASAVFYVRAINLGASTVTLSSTGTALNFSTSTNLTFNAGTSQINFTSTTGTYFHGGGGNLIFYNVSFSAPINPVTTTYIQSTTTFNNFTVNSPISAGIYNITFYGNQTIKDTLTVAGATPIRRIFLQSDSFGITTRTLTVNSLAATDCDFRDIILAGTAAGSSPIRAGDCGNNTGITFSSKTVYWNLAGAQNWSAAAWATTSGGTPDINNFPLAQDTAVFDNTGSITGTISMNVQWNIGTFDQSARTTAYSMSFSYQPFIHKNLIMSSAASGLQVWTFAGVGIQFITSNGSSVLYRIAINSPKSVVRLNDAISLSATNQGIDATAGEFDAVSYNVTVGVVSITSNGSLKMGSGTWTVFGTGSCWNWNSGGTFNKGTANIVLSDNTTTARTFVGNSFSYNKLTIGGTTGSSTTTITGNNTFTELASTKTVAHTIALGTTSQTIGAWTITGTAGNIVTVSGNGTFTIVGARVSGVDYLALASTSVSTLSPGEFYAGVNSSGGQSGFIFTAAPTPVTRYWVGGTGTWDATNTTNWSSTSGGSSGASVPTSVDTVIFNSASNATAYTVTNANNFARCGALTFAPPASGNVTWAGSVQMAIHGNFTLPATGLTQSYTGALIFSGSTTGKTITTNGVTLSSSITINGIGCEWTLASALNSNLQLLTITHGSFSTGNYTVSIGGLSSDNNNSRTISLGSSTINCGGNAPISFNNYANLTFNAGTSTINCAGGNPIFIIGANGSSPGLTFYNVSATNTTNDTVTFSSGNIYNNITVVGRSNTQGLNNIIFQANQTINGTLTLSAGTSATFRHFLQSNTLGTTRTLTCNAFSGTDVDFRDINIVKPTDPYFNYVPLLLKSTSTNSQTNNTFLDSSTNNFTITRSGTPTQGSVTPYWPNGYWSNYFNGSTNFIYIQSAGSAFTYTGDFTIEFWVYPINPQVSTYNPTFFTNNANGSGFNWDQNGVGIRIHYANAIFGSGTSNVLTYTNAVVQNVWTHIAVVRSGSTITMYRNGVANGSITYSGTLGYNGCWPAFCISDAAPIGGREFLNGYISNARIVKDTAVYTANFTPPTTPLTAITNTSLLTCQSNQFKDNSTNNFTITTNSSPRVQAFQPFSTTSSYIPEIYGGSGYFNGTTDYLSVPATAFVLTGDFTVESWMWIDSTVVSSRPDNLKYVSVFSGFSSGGTMVFEVQGSASSAGTGLAVYQDSPYVALAASVSIPLNSWVHIAFVRTGTTIYGFVNGQRITLGTSSVTLISASGSVAIGRNQNTTYYSYMKGYISNHRVVNGTAVYTTNFTPPTGILPAVTNTSLLLNVTDSANFIRDNGPNNLTIINNGTATWNTNGPFNQGTTGLVQRQANDGTYMVSGYFNETGILSYNPNLWFSPAITFAGVADTTAASSLPNLGLSGSIYNASTSTGAPQVATQNGVKVLNFNGSTLANLQLATEIDLSTNSSVFFVGYQTANRMVALGGSNASGNGNAFFGWSAADNTGFLFRNSSDGGQTLTGLQSVAGLKVFGMIQGTSTFTYYDNSTIPTNGTYVSGTYKFGKVGARDYSGSFNSQLSTGYLGDIVAFNRAVSNDEAVMIIALLKEKYNIS